MLAIFVRRVDVISICLVYLLFGEDFVAVELFYVLC